MTNNKQTQRSGANSRNIQVDTINYGIGFADARDIALQTFRENFYELSETAKRIATERAEELVSSFLGKLERESPELLIKIEDPDIQYSVVNAQMQYARNGQKQNLDLLTDLLVKRFQVEDGSLKGIVLNESIAVMTKLTLNQIKFTTALFIVKHCKFDGVEILIDYLRLILVDDLKKYHDEDAFFDHLISAGVATNDMSMVQGDLENIVKVIYKEEIGLLMEGDVSKKTEDEIRRLLATDEESDRVFEIWNSTHIKSYSLTSIGKAIAIAYFNGVLGEKEILSLDTWIMN